MASARPTPGRHGGHERLPADGQTAVRWRTRFRETPQVHLPAAPSLRSGPACQAPNSPYALASRDNLATACCPAARRRIDMAQAWCFCLISPRRCHPVAIPEPGEYPWLVAGYLPGNRGLKVPSLGIGMGARSAAYECLGGPMRISD